MAVSPYVSPSRRGEGERCGVKGVRSGSDGVTLSMSHNVNTTLEC
jgi:hypothetical protein